MVLEIDFKKDDLKQAAAKLLSLVKTKTLLFYGEMGAGKTTLISALVTELGGVLETSSPTFSIVNEYPVKNDLVYHFDFYRIETVYEALDFGVEEYFDSGCWNYIEWPQKIESLIPEPHTLIELTIIDSETRNLKLTER
jgi:tRNA threonylcarbamoyladenosine biosynthesis protein TsaE